VISGYKDNPTNKDTILGPEGILITRFYCISENTITKPTRQRYSGVYIPSISHCALFDLKRFLPPLPYLYMYNSNYTRFYVWPFLTASTTVKDVLPRITALFIPVPKLY
jgi:hypothetical protein